MAFPFLAAGAIALGSAIFGGTIKRKQNLEETKENNNASLKSQEASDATKLELAKLEAKLKEKELENELAIAKIQAESMNKNQVNDLRRYAGSREYANYTNGGRRSRGSRPWA